MADQLTPGPHHRESEFRVPGQFGTCGPCALAMAAWNATGRETHTENVYALMRSHGLCDVSGASTPAALFTAAQLLDLNVIDYYGYKGDDWSGWSAFLGRHAGKAVIVLELANGQALHDEVSGKGENASNLHYHYIALYGPQGDGWAAADGDNWAVGDVLQRYSLTTLNAAKPCAALAIYVPSEAPTMAWHQQHDGSGKDDAGHACGVGDYNYLVAHGLTGSNGLAAETFYDGDNSYLPLDNGRVVTAHHVGGNWTVDERGAQALVAVAAQLTAANAKIAALEASAGGSGGSSADPTATQAIEALMAAFAAHSKAS